MFHSIRSSFVAILLALSVTACGGGVESSMKEFAGIYGELAGVLQQVDDVTSAQSARPKIDALVPKILSAGEDLAKAVGRSGGQPDVSMEVMMACSNQQVRVANQLQRLRDDEEVWPIIRPALEQTMVLQAMPPR